ncbi:MAG: hypothetical protein ACE5IY_15550 [bacterium]
MGTTTKAYEELIDFIAAGTKPDDVIAYEPSQTAKERVANLIHKEKTSSLTSEEKSELDNYMQLEHIMRLAKARARRYVAS